MSMVMMVKSMIETILFIIWVQVKDLIVVQHVTIKEKRFLPYVLGAKRVA